MSLLLGILPPVGESYTSAVALVSVAVAALLLIGSSHLYRYHASEAHVAHELTIDAVSIAAFVAIVLLLRRRGLRPLAVYKPTVAYTLLTMLPAVALLHVAFFVLNNPYWDRASRSADRNMYALSRVYAVSFLLIITLSFFHRTRKYIPTALMCLSAYYAILWEDKVPNNGETLIVPVVIAAIKVALMLPAYRVMHLESFRDPHALEVEGVTRDEDVGWLSRMLGVQDYATVRDVDTNERFTIEETLYKRLGACEASGGAPATTCFSPPRKSWEDLLRQNDDASTP